MYRTRRSTRAAVTTTSADNPITATSHVQESAVATSVPSPAVSSQPLITTRRSAGRVTADNTILSDPSSPAPISTSDSSVNQLATEKSDDVEIPIISQPTLQLTSSVGRNTKTRRGPSAPSPTPTTQLRRSERSTVQQVVVDNESPSLEQDQLSESNAEVIIENLQSVKIDVENNKTTSQAITTTLECPEVTDIANDVNSISVIVPPNQTSSSEIQIDNNVVSIIDLDINPSASTIGEIISASTLDVVDASTNLKVPKTPSPAILEIEKSIIKGVKLISGAAAILGDNSGSAVVAVQEGEIYTSDNSDVIKDTGSSSDSSSVRSFEGESPKPSSTYYLTVGDDGTIYFNPAAPEAPPVTEAGETFSVKLPSHKIKSPTNPLPGPPPSTGRSRKSKPQSVTYGGESHVGFLDSTGQSVIKHGNLINMEMQVEQGAVLNNKSHSQLERQSSSGVVAHTAAPPPRLFPVVHIPSSPTLVQLDVSKRATQSIDVSEFETHLDPQSIAVLENVLQSDQGREILTEALGEMNVQTNVQTEQALLGGVAMSRGPGRPPGRPSNINVSSPVTRAVKIETPVSRKNSEDANIRRSQRQQDRFDRQEAERIMAENQQMLQKEKEIMSNAKALADTTVSAPTFNVHVPDVPIENLPPQPPIISDTILTPQVNPVCPPPMNDVSYSPVPVVVLDSRNLDDGTRRPIRNRKLPAHLADPNYLSLEDAATAVKEATRRSSTNTHEILQTEEVIMELEVEEIKEEIDVKDEEEDYTEDDPNRLWCICRQPHNNRFMICCDRCEEWFHGKCVNVTKAQGKAMELKEIPWHCPNCKKAIFTKKKVDAQTKFGVHNSANESPSVTKITARGKRSHSQTETPPHDATSKVFKQAVSLETTPGTDVKGAATTLDGPQHGSGEVSTRRGRKRSERMEMEIDDNDTVTSTVTCKKPARSSSVHISDESVQKSTENVDSKVSTDGSGLTKAQVEVVMNSSNSSVPGDESENGNAVDKSLSTTPKFKRSHSFKLESNPDPIFNFHVINAGASVSTKVVPHKPKELTASALLKAQMDKAASITGTTVVAPKNPPTTPTTSAGSTSLTSPRLATPVALPSVSVQGISPNSVATIVQSSPSVAVQKVESKANVVDLRERHEQAARLKTPSTPDSKSSKVVPSSKSSSGSKPGSGSSSKPSSGSSSKPSSGSSSKPSSGSNTKSSSGSGSSSGTSRPRTDSTSKSNEKRDSHKDQKPMDGPSSEKLHRENMRKSLREILKNRMNDMPDADKKKIEDTGVTPEAVSSMIEEELVSYFGGANNSKCKIKYRSIYFNLKDEKNKLFQEILLGSVKPYDMVRMTPEQMASTELAQWRQQQKEKELEAIKRAELDKLAEAKKQELIDKGVEDAMKVAEDIKPLDISDVIAPEAEEKSPNSSTGSVKKERIEGRERSSSHHHSRRHRHDKRTSREDEKDKNRRRRSKERRSDKSKSDRKDSPRDKEVSSDSKSVKHKSSSESEKRIEKERGSLSNKKSEDQDNEGERSRSSRHRDKPKEKDRERERDASYSSKDADKSKNRHKSGSEKKPEERSATKQVTSKEHLPDVVVKGIEKKVETGLVKTIISTSSELSTTTLSEPSVDTSLDKGVEEAQKKMLDTTAKGSAESEQELPSSTIKTPDFTDNIGNEQDNKLGEPGSIFQSTIQMPELGEFKASFFNVSHHDTPKGVCFPESPVPIVGRIGPQTVWDYIDKMKKSKEIITFRLTPASAADAKGYMTFFTYLSSRERLGVIGGIFHPLKDVYLIPLDKHQPVPRCLLPFQGPGLPAERTHCLLAVVTRHTPQESSQKRKVSSSSSQLKKRAKSDSGKEPHQKNSPALANSKALISPNVSSPAAAEALLSKDDENEPYTPWEDEEPAEASTPIVAKAPSKMIMLSPDINPSSSMPETSHSRSSSKSAAMTETQKKLAEIEAQIAKEKQNIDTILAGAKNVVGIPGLDGDFSETVEPTKPPSDISEFQRTTPMISSLDPRSTRSSIFKRQPTSLPPVLSPAVSVVSSSSSIPGLDTPPTPIPVFTITDEGTAADEKVDESPSPPHLEPELKEVSKVDSEAAYSPSAMDYLEEEKAEKVSAKEEQNVESESVPSVSNVQLVDLTRTEQASDNQTEFNQKSDVYVPSQQLLDKLDDRQTQEIKIILSKFTASAASSEPAGLHLESVSKDELELVEDSHVPPPPPGEVSVPKLPPLRPPTSPKSNKIFEDSPFEKAFISPTQSKVKININLSTKILPSVVSNLPNDTSASVELATDQVHPQPTTDFKDIDERQRPNSSATCSLKAESIPLPPLQFGVPPPMVLHQPPAPILPLHLPPPPLQNTLTGSVVINLNVPPPPFIPLNPPVNMYTPPPPMVANLPVEPPTTLIKSPLGTPTRDSFAHGSMHHVRTSTGPPHLKYPHSSISQSKSESDKGVSALHKDRDVDKRDHRSSSGRESHSRSRVPYDRRRHHDRGDRSRRRSRSRSRGRVQSRSRSRSRSGSRSRDHKRRRHSRSKSRSPVRRPSRKNLSSRSRSPAM